MEFRFVRQCEGRAKTYQGQTVATDEVVEFTGHFIEKADRNPDFERVEEVKTEPRTRSKKKVSRRGQNQG